MTSAEMSPENDSQRHNGRAAAAQPPSARQLAETRKERWHQDGKPLTSQEALRDWIARCGLVAYGQRALQLGAPAPSVLEAVEGAHLDPDAPPASESTRTLLLRLIASGSIVPLNLLGTGSALGTDIPDFVASAAVFSYIFTLRGAKVWKRPPATSGAVKVSPLALAIYEMLDAKVTLSAAELATNLGKEVTESAVLRALNELWSQLRVLPLPQSDGAATQWELASARFTKQIKSGANAGQPSALSALISLYLGQAVAASEDEIETFLSPLAPRSKVRDVLHALLPARQLETVVVDGKTLLHVAGEMPTFQSSGEAGDVTEVPPATVADAPRIRKFAGKPANKIGSGLRARPQSGGRSGFASRSGSAMKPEVNARPAPADRERRPFRRDESERPARSAFDKPWNEGKQRRLDTDRDLSASGDAPRAGKRTFSKPGTFGRKREGAAGGFAARSPREFGRGQDHPSRSEEGRRPEEKARGGLKREGGKPGGRPAGKAGFGGRPGFEKKSGGPRYEQPEGAGISDTPRKAYRKFDAPRGAKPHGKTFRGEQDARPGGPRVDRGRSSSDRPGDRTGDRRGRDQAPGERPARRFGAPGRPAGEPGSGKPFRPRGGPGGKPAFGNKPAFGSKPATGGKKPFQRAGGVKPGAGGGFKPVKRQRPERNQ